MPSVIETIAAHAVDAPAFGDRAILLATHALADTLGCMVAGREDEASVSVREAFRHREGSGSALLVGGGRADAATAALVNATAAHALDYDDNFRPGITHASAVLVPTLLALAQERGATGRALLDAYLAGLAAQAAVGEGLNPSHYTIGWHATATVGAIGTAAGAARLIGLDAAGAARAMSIAVSMAGGPKGQFGTPAKPLHAGLAARNAVEAARLAETGMTGRLDILEGQQGFLELAGGPDAPGWGGLDLAGPHVIETAGLMPKRHPCCGSTHNVVDAILDLKAAHGFSAAETASVETRVGIANARNLAYADPSDEMQARFSMPYCVALALLQDRLSLADFTPEAVRRPHVRALLPLTTMTAHSAEEERAAGGRPPHRVTVRLADGRVLRAERREAKGTIADPFSDADRREKFADCCAGLGEDARETLYAAVASLGEARDCDGLAPAFARG